MSNFGLNVTAHYTHRNADLNYLIPAATIQLTDLIFKIIKLLRSMLDLSLTILLLLLLLLLLSQVYPTSKVRNIYIIWFSYQALIELVPWQQLS